MTRKNLLAAILAGLLALGAVACEVEDDGIDDPLENGNGVENGVEDDTMDDGLEDDGLEDDGLDDTDDDLDS